MSACSRFFVSDLPAQTNESDLEKIFRDYGDIEKLELKCKENLVDPEDVKRIAFVTLKVDKNQAQYCLRELNWHKICGQRIKVSLAKESFLERLQREREAAAAAAAATPLTTSNGKANAELPESPPAKTFNFPPSTGLNKRTVFADDLEETEPSKSDDSDELNICKKSARNSLFNGRVVIQSHGFVKPLHIIGSSVPKGKGQRQAVEAERTIDDEKRRQSLAKRKQDYQQKKALINHSLKDLKVQGKITRFDDGNDEDDDANTGRTPPRLFNDSVQEEEDNDCGNFLQKTLSLDGRRAAKLLKMQSNQSNDPRFRIDERFVEDEAESKNDPAKEEQTGEREWQLRIMEQVAGVALTGPSPPVEKGAAKHKRKDVVNMLRYDPTQDGHAQYEKLGEQEVDGEESTTVIGKETTSSQVAEVAAEVSKEVFYKVTDSLQEALRNRGSEQFSLLDMFDSCGQHKEKRDKHLRSLADEKILVEDGGGRHHHRTLVDGLVMVGNPFKYDSSSSDEENEEIENGVETVNSSDPSVLLSQTKQKVKRNDDVKLVKISMEKFFFDRKDRRLKEGAQFFRYECKEKEDGTTPINYDIVRENLKKLIKTKIAKSKRQMTKAGFKQHKIRRRAGKGRQAYTKIK